MPIVVDFNLDVCPVQDSTLTHRYPKDCVDVQKTTLLLSDFVYPYIRIFVLSARLFHWS